MILARMRASHGKRNASSLWLCEQLWEQLLSRLRPEIEFPPIIQTMISFLRNNDWIKFQCYFYEININSKVFHQMYSNVISKSAERMWYRAANHGPRASANKIGKPWFNKY